MAYKRLLLAQNVTKPSMYMVPTRPPGRCVGLVFSFVAAFVAAFFFLSGTKAEFLPFTAFNLAMSTGSTFLSCHGRVWDEHARFFHHPQKKEWRGYGGFFGQFGHTIPCRGGGAVSKVKRGSEVRRRLSAWEGTAFFCYGFWRCSRMNRTACTDNVLYLYDSICP